jgi:intracellular septation protein
MKLLFDLFPVILFFAFYKFGNAQPETAAELLTSLGIILDEGTKPGIFLATLVAIAATVAQIIWTKFRHGKVDTMLWVSFAIITVFGGATLLLHDETFIKWKPTVLYWMFSAILLVSNVLFNKNLMRTLLQEKIALPLHIWHRLNLSWSLFFAVLGFLNLYVAFNYSTDAWVNFKLFGFTALMLVFVLAQGAWLSKYVDEKKESN